MCAEKSFKWQKVAGWDCLPGNYVPRTESKFPPV